MPTKTDDFWVGRIRELAERRPKMGAVKIETELGIIAARENKTGYPGLTTIKRLLAEHRRLTDRERAIYREFRWPLAMVTNPELPWEASRLALDVLKEEWLRHKERPSIRRVLWHWRVSLAIPDADYEGREPYVNGILGSESANQVPRGPMDWMLAFDSWTDAGNQKLAEAMPDGFPENMTGGE